MSFEGLTAQARGQKDILRTLVQVATIPLLLEAIEGLGGCDFKSMSRFQNG